jgi:protein-tyrosine-phosphatase
MNILFICTANVSRSFLAEQLFRHEAGRSGKQHFEVASAGMIDMGGAGPDPKMVEFLHKQEIPFQNHSARAVGPEQIEWADRIFVMEERHLASLESFYPESADKIERLGAYISAGAPPVDIVDPFGLTPYHYRSAISQISLAVKNLVGVLSADQS